MAVNGIPVTLVDDGTPITPTNMGIPVTIVGGTTTTTVSDGDPVTVQNSAHTDPIAGTAHVVSGAVQDVHLPATVALVSNGEANQISVTGVFINTVTYTVAGGVVTAIVLS